LESAAAHHKWTITDEVVFRLRASFARDRSEASNPAMRGLCFLFSELGGAVHSNVPDWRSNPFLFRAFKLAVAKLLDELEPSGDMGRPPDSFVALWKDSEMLAHRIESPTSLADQAAGNVLWAYKKTYPPDASWEDAMRSFGIEVKDMSVRLQDSLRHTFYGMADAQRDLKSQRGQ
jgi:hypothetical protein